MTDSARLDRHLCRIHKVDKCEKQRLINTARRQAILYELRALRETFPDPPMVSDLDVRDTSSSAADSPADHMGNVSRMIRALERESCGPLSSAKRRDNARQRAKRTEDFFQFCRRTYGPHFFDTMPPGDALLGFLTELYGRNLTVSTVRHYLIDVRIFSSYAADSSEREPSMTEAKLRHLKRACLFQMRQMRGDLQCHRAESRAVNSARVISRESLCKFLKGARRKVPNLIKALAREPTHGIMLLLQGMVAGYLSILTGHRRCVLINMTAGEVSRAGTTQDGFRVISVKHHKTAAFFGKAKIALRPLEHSWITDIISHRPVVSDYVFCTSQGNRCMVLLSHFRTAWRHLRLPGYPDFMAIRTSITTHVCVQSQAPLYAPFHS
ncbi:MAG: hypothetical protein ACRDC7_19880 [Aeromonas veronii]